jgi:ABC-2 type transport system ATP-binding protein
MDPQGREEMLELIIRIHRMLGMAVIVSSHILEDIERVCDYVVIVNGGKLIASQPIASELGPASTDLLVRVDGDPSLFISRLEQAGFQAGPSRDEEARALGEIAVRFDGEKTYDVVRDTAVDLGFALRTLRTRERSLEDLYLGMIEGDGAGDGRA